jgi:hypothetical protein
MLKRLSIALATLVLAGSALAQTTTTPPSPNVAEPPPRGMEENSRATPGLGTSNVPSNPSPAERSLDTPSAGGGSGGSGGSGSN